MGKRSAGAALLCVLMVTVLLGASGCVFLIGRNVNETESGQRIVKDKLAKLKEGVTTRDDVIRAFGAPDQSLTLEGGREIFTYVYERKINSSLTVLLLVSSRTNTAERTRFSFEFKDGLLVRYWEQDMS